MRGEQGLRLGVSRVLDAEGVEVQGLEEVDGERIFLHPTREADGESEASIRPQKRRSHLEEARQGASKPYAAQT